MPDTMPDSLPVIGAALPVDKISDHRDWLFEKDRPLEIQDFIGTDILCGDWQSLADRVKAMLDGHKGPLGIHGPFWGFSLDSTDPGVGPVVTERLCQGLAVCRAIGATQMVVHSPFTRWIHQNAPVFPGILDHMTERVHQTMGPAVAEAKDSGIEIVIENIEDVDPHARVALAESFGNRAVRVSLDTGHAMLARAMSGAPPVDVYAIAAGPRLAHVHLQDVDGFADRHWSLGEGVISWKAVFRAIARHCDGPRLILELRDHGQIPASMAFLEAEGLGQ